MITLSQPWGPNGGERPDMGDSRRLCLKRRVGGVSFLGTGPLARPGPRPEGYRRLRRKLSRHLQIRNLIAMPKRIGLSFRSARGTIAPGMERISDALCNLRVSNRIGFFCGCATSAASNRNHRLWRV